MEIAERVAIITGASAGIGRATAEEMARRGAHVVLVARRAERLTALAEALADGPGRTLVLAGDIGDEAFATELVEGTIAALGSVDILINNAGVGHRSRLRDLPGEDMRRILNTNVLGLMYVTRAVLDVMVPQERGHIVNVSSIVGQRPLPDSAFYCASKTAVNFLTRSLRMELHRTGVVVTAVYPGLTATEFAQARLGESGVNRFGWRGVPATRVARAIARAVEHGRRDVYITPYDWLFTHLNRLFPRTTDALITRLKHLG